MRLKVALSTVTALGLLMGAAAANDGNQAYTAQDGANNSIQVQQGNGPGNNRVGTALAPILQDGNGNSFRELQSLGGGSTSMGGNVVDAGRQLGDSNTFTSNYNGWNSGNNLILDMLQDGNSNSANVFRNSGQNSTVNELRQDGNSNSMDVTQTGTGNTIDSATQEGSNNGSGSVNRHNKGMQLWQIGTGNLITEASIEGSNNPGVHPSSPGPVANPGGYAVLDIKQNGVGNGDDFSTARMIGSGGNQIVIDQLGDYNQFSVLQGDFTSDTKNSARLFQDGNYNEALIDQSGSFNTIGMSFEGDSNGLVGLTGAAGTLVSNSGGLLVAGRALQYSSLALSGNSLTYEVVGNLNKFAFAQIGGGNFISGLVGNAGASDGNQVAVLQNGSNNVTSFTQNGGSNNLSVSQ
ncbi:hypothetical protein ACSBOB_09590 [Mesorhizobium sp. ASY16-5R]|uniref:hypothetical protein n=1 Tax=Mesorhizobium sp. ASY16-5R TaxID=3445772 RepID=UPI003F9F0813